MHVKEYLGKIIEKGDSEDMHKLSLMLQDAIYKLKECDEEWYKDAKLCLYEMAYGKKITQEKAMNWVRSMKPKGEHWDIEETTEAMSKLGYNCDKLEYYVVANMMYNDYYNIVKENEELALKLAYDWLSDVDAIENKLYEYWKHIAK